MEFGYRAIMYKEIEENYKQKEILFEIKTQDIKSLYYIIKTFSDLQDRSENQLHIRYRLEIY
jgi:hypothetical protein